MEVRFAQNRRSQQDPRGRDQSRSESSPQCRMNEGMNGGCGGAGLSGWVQYFTSDGRPYFYNMVTRHTQWEYPEYLAIKYSPQSTNTFSSSCAPDVLPGGIGAQTHGPPGANVFIFHVPNAWEERDLISHFCPFGKIVSARVAADKATGRRLGFGFVSFTSVESSVASVAALNGLSVGGKRLKVAIKRGEEQFAAESCVVAQQQRSAFVSASCDDLASKDGGQAPSPDDQPPCTWNNTSLESSATGGSGYSRGTRQREGNRSIHETPQTVIHDMHQITPTPTNSSPTLHHPTVQHHPASHAQQEQLQNEYQQQQHEWHHAAISGQMPHAYQIHQARHQAPFYSSMGIQQQQQPRTFAFHRQHIGLSLAPTAAH